MPKLADYPSYCPIARALDVLGDRWTLLIMRELAREDMRFTDLRTNLQGIPPNLLSQRLKALTDEGLVATHELPPPAARTVYGLTPTGRSAIPVLRALARFGFQRLKPADERTEMRPIAALSTALRAYHDPVAALDLDEAYEVVVDGEPFTLTTRNALDADAEAVLRIEIPSWALVNIRRGATSLDEMLRAGIATRRGHQRALARFQRVFQID